MDDTICIDSSPLMEDHGFHWSPRRESRNGAMGVVDSPTAASRIAMSPAFVKKAGVPKKSPASTGAPQSNGGRAHQRRSSLQRNLFDAIDDLVKSGKAKPAFDWSMALDTVLLNEAKAKGVDLGLSRAAGAGDDVPVRSTLPPTRPSFFSGIGEPGAFDRLYDEASVRAEPSRHMSLAGGLAVPATETAFQSAEQVLCSGSDCEGSIDADILGEVDNLSLLALDDLEYLTPPITAVPETPPMMLMDKDEGVTMSRASPPLPPPQFVAQTQVVCIDDDDTDAQLLAFDLDSDELFELSDVGIDQSQELRSTEHNRTTSTLLSPPCVQLARSPAFQQDASMLPSSSPLRPRKRAPISAGRSKIEDVDATPPLPSSSPVQRQGGRLVRGKLAGRSASATCVEPMSTPPREKPNKPKLRRPPAKRAFNPFIDSEAEVGDSDDEGQGRRLRVGRAEEDDDEDGSEDLDENLSSFIVEDDHIEFETPGRQGHASDDFSLGQSDVTPRRIGDVYRRSLANETTPVSEIMRRLAEREKRRRWVSDSPTRNAQWAGANSLSLAGSGLGQDGAAGMLTSDVEEDDHSGSSDFEHAEDLFTQAA
ncbi:hypothetical protein GGI20_005759 [Coemansia sp. BCRC 34301]|nr:hypothetical protein GGI20_005759 [Coemansia sp. BCRC 34301]